jgi:hypothetical protein
MKLKNIIKINEAKKDPYYIIGYMENSIEYAIKQLESNNPDKALKDLKRVIGDVKKMI